MFNSKRFAKFVGIGVIAATTLVGLANTPAAQAKGSKNPVSGITVVEVAAPDTYVWFRGQLGPIHMETDATGVATSPTMRVVQGGSVTIQQMPGRTLPPLQSISCTGTTFVEVGKNGPNSVTITIASQNTVCTFTN